MCKPYLILISYLLIFFFTFDLNAQKLNLDYEVNLFNNSKSIFQNKNYEIALNEFKNFKKKFPNSLLIEESDFYIFLSEVYTYKVEDHDAIEKFILNNRDLKYNQLSAAYGEYVFDKGDYNKAIKYLDFSKLTTYDILYKIGFSYYKLENYINAENYLKKIRLSDYKDDASYYLGIIEIKKGNYKSAINYLKSISKFIYQDAIKYYLIFTYYNIENYKEVLKLSEEIDENTLNLNHINYIIGSTYFIIKEYENSLNFYSKYKNKKEVDNRLNFEIGYSLLKINDADSAINIFEKNALNDNYYGQLSSYYLGDILYKQEKYKFSLNAFYNAYLKKFDEEYSLDALYKYSIINYKIENNDESLSSLIEIKEKYPQYKTEEINYLIAENYLKTTNFQKAINFIESLDSIGNKVKRSYQIITFQRGAELFNQGELIRSINYFKKSQTYQIDKNLYLESLFWVGESNFLQKKFPEAYKNYIELLNCNCKIENSLRLNTLYSIAYTLFNNKEYNKSINYFLSYINLSQVNESKLLDAKLRLADSYYAIKSYSKSIDIYNSLLYESNLDKNYLLYQIGLANYGRNNNQKSIEYLTQIIENDSSNLIDDAIFRIASIYFETSKFDSSIVFLSKIIDEYQNSEYLSYSYLKRAVSYYNLKSYEQSENDYLFLLKNFKSKEIYNESILGIQKVVNFTENFSILSEYLEKFKNLYPDDKSIESIEFETIKNLYFSQNYYQLISLSNEFINTYQESTYLNEVKFLLGESNYKLKNYDASIINYQYLITIENKKYFNRSINKLGKIYFDIKSYDESLKYYKILNKNVINNRELTDAYLGIVNNFYNLKVYDSSIYYSQKLLIIDKISFNLKNKANLFIAKSYIENNQINNGIDYLLTTINLVKDESGAEAQYLLAKIFYDKSQLNQSIETLYLLNDNFSEFNYWRGKGYLLIAKIFIDSEEFFQAKSTLESLIEKNSNEEIKKEAEDMLNEINTID